MDIITEALKRGESVLSEFESKKVLKAYGIPVTHEIEIHDVDELDRASKEVGYPLVIKACAPNLAHKTERGMVHVDIRTKQEAVNAIQQITAEMGKGCAILVQEMVNDKRELVIGLTRDFQFGPCVIFGLGGILTEILKDISFRVAPIKKKDAKDMMMEIRGKKILGAIRRMPPANMDQLADILIKVGEIGLQNESIKEIDINPVILNAGSPVAVDALIVLNKGNRL